MRPSLRTPLTGLLTALALGTGLLASATPASATAPSIELSTPAAGAIDGVAFDTQPIVRFLDANGAVDTTVATPCIVTVTAALTSTPSTAVTLINGPTTATPIAGVAAFSGLGIDDNTVASGTPVTLTYTPDATDCAAGLTPVTQTITPTGAASAVAIMTNASSAAVSGRPLTAQPVVKIVDSAGTTVTTGTPHTVTVSIGNGATSNSATATLSGTTSKTTVNGIATFTDLVITNVGNAATPDDYVLTYAATSLTSAVEPTPTTLTLGVATQAVVTTVAAGAVSGSAFTTQPVITLRDAGNLTVPDPACTVTASVTAGSLVGTNTATTVNGVATFSNLGISGNPSTTYTITYTAAKTSSAPNCTLGNTTLTVTQTVTMPGPTATRLVLSRAAANAINGHTVYIQPQVTQTDANGVTTTSTSTTVTVTGSSGATLSGTTTATTSNGIAAFTGLIVSGTPGTTYTLTYSASGLTSATQQITVSVASNLGVLRAPSGISSGIAFAVQPQISRHNASGTTIIENPQTTVTASISGGATLIGSTTATTVNGVATFGNLGIAGTNGAAYSLTFTAPGMTATAITVTVGTPAVATTTTTTTAAVTTTSGTTSTTAANTKNATPSRVRPLGGGVSVVPKPASAPKVLRTPTTRRLDQAQARTISRNNPVRFVLSDQPRGEQVTVAVRINGRWNRVEQVRVGADRKITLTTMQFARAGSYPMRLRSPGYEHTQYARIVVR